MRMYVGLNNGGDRIELPAHYNYLVQSAIYSLLPRGLSKKIHDEGFPWDGRKFKLFTFSRILGKARRKNNGKITFSTPVKIAISSAREEIIESLAHSIVKEGEITLGNCRLEVCEIRIPREINIDSELKVKTLSPITVYSTLFTADGRKKTYYYTPWEEDFKRIVEENLRKKYAAIHGSLPDGKVEIVPLGRLRETVSIYKGFIIRGWNGRFLLRGDRELIKIAYDAGIGSKNSLGFGMVEVAR